MSKSADIILIGHGSGDALQLTLQAQMVLQRHGFAFAIGVPPMLRAMLTSSGIELDHLDARILAVDEPRDSLLVAADIVLKQTEIEAPVILLAPGNPLFLNSLSRLLLSEGQARGLTVQRIAGISQFDVIVNELGIDIAARGVQVFDAAQVARGRSVPVAGVPTLMFRAGDLRIDDGSLLASLHAALSSIYPNDHPVTMFNVDPASDATSFATAALHEIDAFADHLHSGSSLYVGPVKG